MNFTKNFLLPPRRMGLLPRLATFGVQTEKRTLIQFAFTSFNFSLVLNGSGRYQIRGKTVRIKGPAVLLQWPNEPMHYGPDSVWDEIFLIYPASEMARWRQAGIEPEKNNAWQVADPEGFLEACRQLQRAAESEVSADRIDLLAYSAVAASLLPPPPGKAVKAGQLNQLRRRLREAPGDSPALEEYARNQQLSVSTLRRRWKQAAGGVPVAREIGQWRLAEAARLLGETALPVQEIARRVGFGDPYYFSRRFRQQFGGPPRAYRARANQAPEE